MKNKTKRYGDNPTSPPHAFADLCVSVCLFRSNPLPVLEHRLRLWSIYVVVLWKMKRIRNVAQWDCSTLTLPSIPRLDYYDGIVIYSTGSPSVWWRDICVMVIQDSVSSMRSLCSLWVVNVVSDFESMMVRLFPMKDEVKGLWFCKYIFQPSNHAITQIFIY